MKLNGLVPMLWVDDIEQTLTFYRDVLGFECANQMESWACLVNQGVELMISLPIHHQQFDKPQFTGSFYFKTDYVDELWERLKDKSTVVYPIEDFSYVSLPFGTTAVTFCSLANPSNSSLRHASRLFSRNSPALTPQ